MARTYVACIFSSTSKQSRYSPRGDDDVGTLSECASKHCRRTLHGHEIDKMKQVFGQNDLDHEYILVSIYPAEFFRPSPFPQLMACPS